MMGTPAAFISGGVMSMAFDGSFWVAQAMLYGGLRFWVPQVVRHYGRTYFDQPAAKPWRFWGIFPCLPAAGALAVAASFYPGPALPFLALIGVALGGLTLADARFQVIPDRFQVVGAVGALGFALLGTTTPLTPKLVAAGIGLAMVAALYGTTRLYTLVRKRDALGFGDVKLLAWLSLAFGPDTFYVMVYGMGLALLAVVPLLLMRRRTLHSFFAFGPFLAGAAVLRLVEMTILR
jgi:leader peptidase HopD